MLRTKVFVGAAATALALCALLPLGRADDSIAGTYPLSGRQKQGWWPWGPKTTATLWVSGRNADGTHQVARTSTYRGGPACPTQVGTARVEGGKLRVTFTATAGLSGALTGETAGEALRAEYTIKNDGRIDGWSEAIGRGGKKERFNESGRKGADQAWPTTEQPPAPEPVTPPGPVDPNLRVERPANGRVALAGQTIPLALVPAEAALDVQGPARREGPSLVLTGPGRIVLTARHEGRSSAPVTIEAVTPQITEVTVEDAITITDARPPHFRRPLNAPAGATEPAAMLKDRPLKLAVKLQAPKSLSEAAVVRLAGGSGNARFDAEVSLRDLAGGQVVRVESQGPLTNAVAVNALDLPFTLSGRELGRVTLRIYTLLAPPVENPMPKYAPAVRPVTLATKLHFELACTWANGATRNVGDGLCFMIDNRFAHHVHPKSYGNAAPPAVPAYASGSEPPVNYDDLPGYISGTTRSASSGLYYPPLQPTKDYEQYRHYAGNFGWWVLDNPRHTGGRCNQQASLIADIFGTVGVRARVYYIERVASGKRTGRPMRRYYKSSRSDKSWNFHGVTEAELEGGVKWLYDGSGSYPTRINGQTEKLMKVPDGPFVDFWHPWSYEDTGGSVPREDYPDTWEGVPLQPGEQLP